MEKKEKIKWNPFTNSYIANPYPHLKQCREENPIQKSVINTWVFFKHEDVAYILKSNDFSTLEISEVFAEREPYIFKGQNGCPFLAASTKNWPMHLNGLAHKTIRSLIGKAVSLIDLEEVLDLSFKQLTDLFKNEKNIDLAYFCAYFQYLMIKNIFSIRDSATYEDIKTYSNMLAKAQDSLTPKQVHLKINEWLLWGRDLFGASKFKDDILQHGKELNLELSADELYSVMAVSMAASFETTKDTLAYGILKAMADQETMEWLLSTNEEEINAYVEEIIRLFSPAQYTLRINNEEIDYKGHFIPKGSRIMLCIASANRDAEIFESPDEIVLNRSNQHIAFGKGIHFCLGSQVARNELKFALKPMIHFLKKRNITSINKVEMGKQVFMRTFETVSI